MKEGKLAILDLGTNTFHLLIVEIMGGKPETILRERFAVKIGKSGINQRKILPAAINRAISALKKFNKLIDKYEVKEVKAIATSAFRNAANGQLLIDRIKKATGINVSVIDGLREAEYVYYGVCQSIEIGDKPILIMDIGGGSVECIIGNQHTIFWKKSFEIGAQRLFDEFHKHDPVLENDINLINKSLDIELKPLIAALGQHNPTSLIGSSGTFDTLSEISRHNRNNSTASLSVINPISKTELLEILDDIIPKNREERLKIPGMVEMRVDMMSVASLLVKFTLNASSIKSIRYSPNALKEGYLYSLINETSFKDLSA